MRPGEDFKLVNRKSAEGTKKNTGGSAKKTTADRPAASENAPVSGKTTETPAPDIDQLGELPRNYGSDTIFLVAQEPHWLFTYWDIDISRHPGGQTFLRVHEEDQIEAEIEVPFETRNWYIPVKVAGSRYMVEIGYYRGSTWNVISRSITIQTPPDSLSKSEQFNFATIPLHLSFQKLVENVQASVQAGESLLHALSRLQQDGKFPGFVPGLPADSFMGQRIILEALLGEGMVNELSSGAFSSEEIEARIRQHLEEKLHSQGASELLSSGIFAGSGASLFEAFGAISSWSPSAISSWATAALTSWTAGASGETNWGGETSGSWSAAAQSSWGPTELASWLQAAQSSWPQTALSSWIQGGQTSWSEAALSSWLQAAQTSWAEAALSSWNQGALTSWTQAATTSWSGGSENVSSFGFSQRNFFMNVNAEVIFYGGTDPRAKVTIDGKPVTLNPDGTFRHHFIFPDGAYEIPIVATSPDGVETRSAILRFDRGTLKHGQVDNTAQPPLGVPMGALS